jgi:hypothetical protein
MIRLNPSHSHTLIIVVSRSVIPIYLDEFSCQHNAMSVIDLPLDVIFEIANWLPTSSYTALALTCGPLYKSLDHRRWTPSPLPYHRRGTDDSFKLLPLLAVGPFVSASPANLCIAATTGHFWRIRKKDSIAESSWQDKSTEAPDTNQSLP